MAVRRTNCYEQALACDQFDKFCNANNLKDILQGYQNLCCTCSLSPTNFTEFYPKIKVNTLLKMNTKLFYHNNNNT